MLSVSCCATGETQHILYIGSCQLIKVSMFFGRAFRMCLFPLHFFLTTTTVTLWHHCTCSTYETLSPTHQSSVVHSLLCVTTTTTSTLTSAPHCSPLSPALSPPSSTFLCYSPLPSPPYPSPLPRGELCRVCEEFYVIVGGAYTGRLCRRDAYAPTHSVKPV